MKSSSQKYGMRLTFREKEIAPMAIDGLTSKLIAERLCISEYTVANHRKNILEKKGVKDFKELRDKVKLFSN